MLGTALIVFRETIEAALVIGIVLAATREVARRGLWISAGVVLGGVGAGLAAMFAEQIATAASGMGQEVFNAAVLFTAVAMLGWHNIWMGRHGRDLARQMSALGRDVAAGARPLPALAVIVGLAILREGSEVVLFLYGIAAGGGQTLPMLSGGFMGLATGCAMGMAMYLGLLRIPGKYLFGVTSWMILLLAAGMAAQAAGYLAQAGLLPTLEQPLWDTSRMLSEHGVVGQVLHTLVGYEDHPAGIQLLFYLITLITIGGLMKLYGQAPLPKRSACAAVAVAAGILLLAAVPDRARASHKVFYPIVEKGEVALEARGHVDFDTDAAKDEAQKYKFEVEYGVTDYWWTGVEFEYEKEHGEDTNFEATEFENIFQIFPQGARWLDAGMFFEYAIADDEGKADKIEFGPLLQKQFGRLLATTNFFFEKEIGSNAEEGTEFSYAMQFKWRWRPEFEPGIEAFGKLGEVSDIEPVEEQEHQIGPVALGSFALGGAGKLKYQLGLLFGLTGATPDRTLRWLVEYEF